jgi:hypothetical protein
VRNIPRNADLLESCAFSMIWEKICLLQLLNCAPIAGRKYQRARPSDLELKQLSNGFAMEFWSFTLRKFTET